MTSKSMRTCAVQLGEKRVQLTTCSSISQWQLPETNHFSFFSLLQKTCLLSYNGNYRTAGTYAVALTLEDFPAGTTNFDSITPFSAVGLQFLVIISSHSGSCNNVPVFTPVTPNDGECSEVQIGSVYRTVIEVTLADLSKQ